MKLFSDHVAEKHVSMLLRECKSFEVCQKIRCASVVYITAQFVEYKEEMHTSDYHTLSGTLQIH